MSVESATRLRRGGARDMVDESGNAGASKMFFSAKPEAKQASKIPENGRCLSAEVRTTNHALWAVGSGVQATLPCARLYLLSISDVPIMRLEAVHPGPTEVRELQPALLTPGTSLHRRLSQTRMVCGRR